MEKFVRFLKVGILIFVLFYLLLKMLTCIEKAIRQMTQMQYANGS